VFKLHWLLRKKHFMRVSIMTEPNSRTFRHILSFLEGEKIRIILLDGSIAEGKMLGVTTGTLRLDDTIVPINKIATYFVLQEP